MNYLTDAGIKRADGTGLAEYLHLDQEPGGVADREIWRRACRLRSCVRRSSRLRSRSRFVGWNEGINTSASLSYLLGTYFRQLPTNESKRLDIIPGGFGVPRDDADCGGDHGAAARPAVSAGDFRDQSVRHGAFDRTDFAGHRKHYRAQEGLEYWLRLRFDAIPVSKERYNRMSAPAQKAIIKSIQRIMSPLPLKKTPLAQGRAQPGKSGKTDRVVRAVHSAQRT